MPILLVIEDHILRRVIIFTCVTMSHDGIIRFDKCAQAVKCSVMGQKLNWRKMLAGSSKIIFCTFEHLSRKQIQTYCILWPFFVCKFMRPCKILSFLRSHRWIVWKRRRKPTCATKKKWKKRKLKNNRKSQRKSFKWKGKFMRSCVCVQVHQYFGEWY